MKKMASPKKTFWQFILFLLLSIITTVVDLGTFALFNYVLFVGLKSQPFQWFLFDYSLVNGGLGSFLSFLCSFLISQTFNFFIQRKVTFGATNRMVYSAMMYAAMVIGVLFFQLWIPTLMRDPLAHWVGESWADFLVKNVNMTISFLIQFPMNKWVIMRHKKSAVEPH